MDSFGKTDFIKKHYNKTYEELTEEERNTVDKEYAEYSKTKEKQDALRGYDRMYNLQEKLGLKFEELANKMKEDLSLFDPKHSVYT
jgi:ribosome-binding protein aMBF1 (putative translation factor)